MPEGLDDIMKNLGHAGGAGEAGLYEAGLYVKAKSQKICPIDTAHLVGSAYVDLERKKESGGTILSQEVGYWADYAPYVHEMPDSTNWQRPGAENKFLEKAIFRHVRQIMMIMGAETQQELRKR